MNRAAALALSDDLTVASGLGVAQVDSVNAAYGAKATRFVHSYFFLDGSRLQLRGTVEDAATHKTVQTVALTGPLSGGILPLVNQMAKQLNGAAAAFGTASAAAFQAFGEALNATDAGAQEHAFETATRADPNFSAAYVAWADVLLRRGDRGDAARVAAAGMSDRARPLDQARLAYLAASAKGDGDGQLEALRKWSALTKEDRLVRQLADLELARRKFADAARDYETAATRDPDDTSLWNSLGYAQAYAGDLQASRRSLGEYQKRSPDDVNALDSLGEVSFYLGDFAAAEKYFEDAHRRNPRALNGLELLKAAQARLMTGDLNAADNIFQRYLDFRKTLPGGFVDLQQAQWEFLTGRRQQAIQRLQSAVPHLDANTSAIALCQLSIWKLQTGDQKSAVEYAQQAAQRASIPTARIQSEICAFLASGKDPRTALKTVNALAFLFQKKYDRALPELEAAYREANPNTDGQVRAQLAWANVETGRMEAARALLKLYPIPLQSGDVLFSSLTFPRIFYLKGAVLENEGKRDEAKRDYRLYLKFAGNLPSIFGDEEKARKAL